jgi:hypothetical protein
MQRFTILVVVATILVGCAAHHRDAWNAPLAPTLEFQEVLSPGTIAVLVIDAHSGAPLSHSLIGLYPRGRITSTDSLGRARFESVAPGRHVLHVRSIGYEERRDSVSMIDSGGLAVVVQLRRAKPNFSNVTVGEPR